MHPDCSRFTNAMFRRTIHAKLGRIRSIRYTKTGNFNTPVSPSVRSSYLPYYVDAYLFLVERNTGCVMTRGTRLGSGQETQKQGEEFTRTCVLFYSEFMDGYIRFCVTIIRNRLCS